METITVGRLRQIIQNDEIEALRALFCDRGIVDRDLNLIMFRNELDFLTTVFDMAAECAFRGKLSSEMAHFIIDRGAAYVEAYPLIRLTLMEFGPDYLDLEGNYVHSVPADIRKAILHHDYSARMDYRIRHLHPIAFEALLFFLMTTDGLHAGFCASIFSRIYDAGILRPWHLFYYMKILVPSIALPAIIL